MFWKMFLASAPVHNGKRVSDGMFWTWLSKQMWRFFNNYSTVEESCLEEA